MRIDRNLGILKITLFFPTLSDQYNTGPFEVVLTRSAIINMGKEKTIKNIEARTISNIRFILPDYSFCDYFFSVVPVPHKSGSISWLHISLSAHQLFCIPLCSFSESLLHRKRRLPPKHPFYLSVIHAKKPDEPLDLCRLARNFAHSFQHSRIEGE